MTQKYDSRAAEAYFNLWSARCEVTRRFSFEECQSMICRAIDVDGEYFVHLTRHKGEPRLQLIEAHRIGDGIGSVETIDGIGLDAFGAPAFYRVIEDSGEPSDPVSLQKIVGGKLVALKPDESLDSFQSNRPSPTFTGFLEHLRRDSALGMIPFEFAADSSKVGGAGVRLIVAKADSRFSFRQMILERRLIRPVWAWVIGDAIARGLLPAAPNWWKICTVPPKRVTVDAGREAQQNRADVEMGLKTLSDHFQELGADFGEEIERRAADAKLILETAEKHGVPVEMLWKPSGGPITPPLSDEPPPGR